MEQNVRVKQTAIYYAATENKWKYWHYFTYII